MICSQCNGIGELNTKLPLTICDKCKGTGLQPYSMKKQIDFIKSLELNDEDIKFIEQNYSSTAKHKIADGVLLERQRILKILFNNFDYNKLFIDQKSMVLIPFILDLIYAVENGYKRPDDNLYNILIQFLEGFESEFSEAMYDSLFILVVKLGDLYQENKEKWGFQDEDDDAISLTVTANNNRRVSLVINKLGQYINLESQNEFHERLTFDKVLNKKITSNATIYKKEILDKDINLDIIHETFEWVHNDIDKRRFS